MPRVTILLGKGGTGRTTIARALALNFAEQGSTALRHANPATDLPDERTRNLSVRVLDPEGLFDDQVHGLFPLGPLTRMVTEHPAYESFLEIAPGIKEAAVLNDVYDFSDEPAERIVLDGPATGHGLHFLQAPSKLERVTTGRVAKRLREINAMLHDPEQTSIVLVALPEELPALETQQLAESLEEEDFTISRLVVNRMPPPVPFETADPQASPRPAPRSATRPGEGASVGSIGAQQALSLLSSERREAERWLDELEKLDLPTRVVPSLPGRPQLAREVATFLEGFG